MKAYKIQVAIIYGFIATMIIGISLILFNSKEKLSLSEKRINTELVNIF